MLHDLPAAWASIKISRSRFERSRSAWENQSACIIGFLVIGTDGLYSVIRNAICFGPVPHDNAISVERQVYEQNGELETILKHGRISNMWKLVTCT